MLVDINILVAASRSDHAQHTIAQKWMTDFLANAQAGAAVDSTLRLSMPVVAGFVRLVTNTRVFREPTSTAQALEYIKALLELPVVEWAGKNQEWNSFEAIVSSQSLAGNDIPDAWLASLAISLSEPFVTFDKGFRQLLPRSLLVLLSATE